ncbi:MAG: hypothetical protein ABI175_01655, partial [Polyangiales bacterium]
MRPPRLLAVVALACALASTTTTAALADDHPPSMAGEYSPYEQTSIDEALDARKLQLEGAPEGKTVEAIEVVSLEVIEKRDPAPRFLNVFHTTTKPYVIGREVLLQVGAPYTQALAEESARNLRDLIQLSVVLVVPVRGSSPDKVRILVITKDVWSFRLNSKFTFVGGKFEYLFLQPSEWNIAGTHHQAAAQFEYQPLSYSLGGLYSIPRILGSRVSAAASANVIIGRREAKPEGSYGSLTIGQPLYSGLTEWAWNVSGTWLNEVTRRYRNGELLLVDAVVTPQPDDIPFQYRTVQTLAGAAVTRSFGWATKNDFSLGFEAGRRVYRTDLAAFDPLAVAAFERRFLPVSDTRVNPYLEYRGYTSRFSRVLDFETLGLQEDFRLGHDLSLKLYPVSTALGSTRTFMGVGTGVQYTVPLGDGLARAGVETIIEAQKDEVADLVFESRERVVTPRLGFGRLVFDGQQVLRPRNHLNRLSTLGGEGRLRGYPTSYLRDRNLVAYSLEFRTAPVEILSCQLGMAFFWDTGDAFDGASELSLKHSGGLGLRMLFPQLDRYVLRFDVGFPVNR